MLVFTWTGFYAGCAYGDVSRSVSFITGVTRTGAGSRSPIETGYAYGGGIEYALPAGSFLNFFRASAVTAKAESRRHDLGSKNPLVATTGGPGVGDNARFSTEGRRVQAYVNDTFDS